MLERSLGNSSGTIVVAVKYDVVGIAGVVTAAEFVCFATHALNSGNKASVNIGSGTTNLRMDIIDI
jgi:hypothetical protein